MPGWIAQEEHPGREQRLSHHQAPEHAVAISGQFYRRHVHSGAWTEDTPVCEWVRPLTSFFTSTLTDGASTQRAEK